MTYKTNYKEGRRLELIGNENTEQRRAATACTRTRWSRERGAETDRWMENAGNARAAAIKTTIKRVIVMNKCNALWGC